MGLRNYIAVDLQVAAVHSVRTRHRTFEPRHRARTASWHPAALLSMLANSNQAKPPQQRGTSAQAVLRSSRPAFAVAPTTASACQPPEPSPRDVSARCTSPIPLLRKTRWEEGDSNSEEMNRCSFVPATTSPHSLKMHLENTYPTVMPFIVLHTSVLSVFNLVRRGKSQRQSVRSWMRQMRSRCVAATGFSEIVLCHFHFY